MKYFPLVDIIDIVLNQNQKEESKYLKKDVIVNVKFEDPIVNKQLDEVNQGRNISNIVIFNDFI